MNVRIFLATLFNKDGTGHRIGIRDALWYATHPEFFGLAKPEGPERK